MSLAWTVAAGNDFAGILYCRRVISSQPGIDRGRVKLVLVPVESEVGLRMLGIFLVLRIRADFDLTVEGSFALGGAVTAVTLVAGGWHLTCATGVLFAGAALADGTFTWGGQGFPNASCSASSSTMLWIFNPHSGAVPTTLHINGEDFTGWQSSGLTKMSMSFVSRGTPE